MFKKILSALARSLDSLNIPYMVIGGQAVLLYGEPRLTRDIDLTLGIDIDRLSDVLQICEAMDLSVLPDDPQVFAKQTRVLPAQDSSSGIRIDFIFSNSIFERRAIERAQPISIEGASVRFASVEDLIIHKIFAGRPRDHEDARSILLKNPNLDHVYILDWLEQFDTALDSDFKKMFETIWKDVQ